MANYADELIDGLADDLGLPQAVMRDALPRFRRENIADIPLDEQNVVRDIVGTNIQELLARKGGVKAIAGGVTADLLYPALKRSREDILASKTISSRVKDFVKDHCLCT